MNKVFYVYIITNYTNSILYTGLTNSIVRRVLEHKTKTNGGFSKKYKAYKLVYFEIFENYYDAQKREDLIKGWKRSWKLELISTINPRFQDLLTSKNYILFG